MIVYAIAQSGGYVKVKVTKHEDRAGAEGWLNATGPEWGGFVFETPEEIPLSRTSLGDLYDKLFGTSLPTGGPIGDLKVRVYDDICDAYKADPFETKIGDYEMAEEKAKGKKKEASDKIEAKTYPAGKVSEFKAVRAGSIRARLLELMNGKHTVDQIAEKLGTTRSNLRVTLNCLQRDCGIGHKTDEQEKVTVLLPGSKTLADAIQAAPEKKVKKKTAKAEEAGATA